MPYRIKLCCEIGKFFDSGRRYRADRKRVLFDAPFDFAHTLQCLIPASFEFIGDQSVLGVRGIKLPLRALRCVPSGLQIPL
jgi:hypothetical protein